MFYFISFVRFIFISCGNFKNKIKRERVFGPSQLSVKTFAGPFGMRPIINFFWFNNCSLKKNLSKDALTFWPKTRFFLNCWHHHKQTKVNKLCLQHHLSQSFMILASPSHEISKQNPHLKFLFYPHPSSPINTLLHTRIKGGRNWYRYSAKSAPSSSSKINHSLS